MIELGLWNDAQRELDHLTQSGEIYQDDLRVYEAEILSGTSDDEGLMVRAACAGDEDERAPWFALAFARLGKLDEARTWLARSGFAQGRGAEAAGDAWLQMGEPMAAAKAYLRTSPSSTRLANAFEALGENREAFRAYKRALRHADYLDAQTVERFARCAERLGRDKEAHWIRGVYERARLTTS